MGLQSVKSFIKRNILFCVMIPGIIGIHIGWRMLQDNPIFVEPGKQKEIPLVEVKIYFIEYEINAYLCDSFLLFSLLNMFMIYSSIMC